MEAAAAAGQFQPSPATLLTDSSGSSTLPEVSTSLEIETVSQLNGPPAGRQRPREALEVHEEEEEEEEDEILSSPAKSIKLEREDSGSVSDEDEEEEVDEEDELDEQEDEADVLILDDIEREEETGFEGETELLDFTMDESEEEDSLDEAIAVSVALVSQSIEYEEDRAKKREEEDGVEHQDDADAEDGDSDEGKDEVQIEVPRTFELEEDSRSIRALQSTMGEVEMEDSPIENLAASKALVSEWISQMEDTANDSKQGEKAEVEDAAEDHVVALGKVEPEEDAKSPEAIPALDITMRGTEVDGLRFENIVAPKAAVSISGASISPAAKVIADEKPAGVIKRKKKPLFNLSLAEFKRRRTSN